ncbi:MAG: hypothetical protein SPJ42_06410, partial [Oscillospiraceae bacterium]|nr:hypothetical protein [Oscillospiraceae bacterium]
TAKLASFGKGGGFCEAKDGGLKIKNNHFFGGSKPPPYAVRVLLIIGFRANARVAAIGTMWASSTTNFAVKFCVFTDSREGCPYDLPYLIILRLS